MLSAPPLAGPGDDGRLCFSRITEGDVPGATAVLADETNAAFLSGYGKGWRHQVRLLVQRGLREETMYVGRLATTAAAATPTTAGAGTSDIEPTPLAGSGIIAVIVVEPFADGRGTESASGGASAPGGGGPCSSRGQEATIEYILDHRFWGRGLGTECAAAAARIAAAPPLRARLVAALIVTGNTASIRVAEKLGFTARGTVTYSMNGSDRSVRKYVLELPAGGGNVS